MSLFGQDVIKSIAFNEGDILRDIQFLHCHDGFDLDPCYSIGAFYERFGIKKPVHKFDLTPQVAGVTQASAESLPIESNTIKTIMFDPPFLAGSDGDGQENLSIIKERFTYFRTVPELWEWYQKCLVEFKRILIRGGVLVFKCQDIVNGRYQYFTHCEVMSMAVALGYYPKDLFILLAKSRIIGHNHEKQFHARKFHCYYWVFTNEKRKMHYGKAY